MAITKIGDKFRKYNILREVNGVHIFSIAGYEFGVKDEAITKAMKDEKAVVVEGIVEYVKPGYFIKDRFKVNGLCSSTEVENDKNKGVKEMKQEKENKEKIGENDKRSTTSKFDEVLSAVARASETILGAWDNSIPTQRKLPTVEDISISGITRINFKDPDVVTIHGSMESARVNRQSYKLVEDLLSEFYNYYSFRTNIENIVINKENVKSITFIHDISDDESIVLTHEFGANKTVRDYIASFTKMYGIKITSNSVINNMIKNYDMNYNIHVNDNMKLSIEFEFMLFEYDKPVTVNVDVMGNNFENDCKHVELMLKSAIGNIESDDSYKSKTDTDGDITSNIDDKNRKIITPISEVERQAITSTIKRLHSELNCDTEIKGYEINDDSMFSVNLAIRESSLSEHMGRVGLFSIMTIDVTGKTSDQMFKQCVDEISKKLAYIIDRADNIAHLKNVNGIDSSVYATASGFRVEFTIRENLGYVWPAISIPLQLDNMSLCLRDVIQKMEVWLSPITASKLIVGVFNFFSEYGVDVSFDGLCINRDDIDSSILKTKDSIPMETVQIRFRIPTNGNNYEIDDWSMGVFTVPINLSQVIYINSSARNTVMNAYIQEYVKMIHDTVCRKTRFTKSSVTMTGNHCDDNPRMIKLTINVGENTNDLRVMINDFDTAVQGVIDLMSVLYDTPTKVIRTSTPNTDNETPDDMVEDYILKESKNISESVYDIISEFEAQCGGSICSIEFLTTDKSIIKITACICQEEETFILHNGKVYTEVDM